MSVSDVATGRCGRSVSSTITRGYRCRLAAAAVGIGMLLTAPSAQAGQSTPTPAAIPRETQSAAAPVPAFFAQEPALRELVLRAVDTHPGLKEAEARYQAAVETVPQVTALPDPAITFTQMLQSVETRVGPQLNTVMVGQAFPWFGKLDLRGQVATAGAEAALAMWQARRRDVIAQVKSAFYNLGYVDTAIAVTEEEQSILEHYERLARDRYASGAGLQQAVIKVQAELTRVLNRLFVLRQQRETLVTRLNTLTDRAPQEPLLLVTLAEPPLEPADQLDLPELVTVGETNRHEVKAADALIGRAERSIALAERNYWPDLVLGAGVVNVGSSRATAPPADSGKNAWTVSLGVTVPIWRNKLRASVRQAGEEMAAQQQARAKLVNDVEFEVRDQVVRLQALADQIRLFRDALLPQAREVQRSTEAAYETGQVSMLDLLDSERVLLDVRLANERQRVDYLIALADLERAIGTPFPR